MICRNVGRQLTAGRLCFTASLQITYRSNAKLQVTGPKLLEGGDHCVSTVNKLPYVSLVGNMYSPSATSLHNGHSWTLQVCTHSTCLSTWIARQKYVTELRRYFLGFFSLERTALWKPFSTSCASVMETGRNTVFCRAFIL